MSHVPTDETRRQVKAMAGYGLDRLSIGTILAIDIATLEHLYDRELKSGPIEAEIKIKQALYNMAVGGDPVAAKIWLQQNAGWS